jgi:alpha-tubulin suppressor-like RCC1 family protein
LNIIGFLYLNPFLPPSIKETKKQQVISLPTAELYTLTHDNKIFTWGVNDKGALDWETSQEGKSPDPRHNKILTWGVNDKGAGRGKEDEGYHQGG